jgi:hypothetical protein
MIVEGSQPSRLAFRESASNVKQLGAGEMEQRSAGDGSVVKAAASRRTPK